MYLHMHDGVAIPYEETCPVCEEDLSNEPLADDTEDYGNE